MKEIQYGFASSFSDLDLDGWPDLAVTGDFTSALLEQWGWYIYGRD